MEFADVVALAKLEFFSVDQLSDADKLVLIAEVCELFLDLGVVIPTARSASDRASLRDVRYR
jgi:hypothetical protein